MNLAQFKDLVSHVRLAGAVVAFWSLTQEVVSLGTFNDKYFWSLNSVKTLGKTPLAFLLSQSNSYQLEKHFPSSWSDNILLFLSKLWKKQISKIPVCWQQYLVPKVKHVSFCAKGLMGSIKSLLGLSLRDTAQRCIVWTDRTWRWNGICLVYTALINHCSYMYSV